MKLEKALRGWINGIFFFFRSLYGFLYSVSHFVRLPGGVPERKSSQVRGRGRTDGGSHREGELSETIEERERFQMALA